MFNFEIVRQNHSFILPQKVVGQSRAKIGWLETVKKLETCVKNRHKKIIRKFGAAEMVLMAEGASYHKTNIR